MKYLRSCLVVASLLFSFGIIGERAAGVWAASLAGAAAAETASPSGELASLSPDDLLARAIENIRELDSYQCRLKLYVTKGDRVQKSEYTFSYRKPNLVRMHVETGKDEGSTVIRREDGRIRGRREGLLSIFAVTLHSNDQRLYDLWDRSFCDSDWLTLLSEMKERLRDAEDVRVEPAGSNGSLILLGIDGKGFVEQTWFDSRNLTLVQKEAWRDNGDYLKVVWSDISLNPQFEDDFFFF
ncbi:MAG: hypothetical protein C4520_19445 [Candidatus Abyssobacteria bacterium SURF_5]|uniref:DUF1571 domain-containing protein n=1 Tax=Abyssobacteria bacterium (strain SURF_5) TaxID=2093360 RepID=A0A3A4N2D6_ABYX5|nr:MAG: hypothetical protein C4520_19445 [Candidatus Abyssubacteria bacterium SURF_5]